MEKKPEKFKAISQHDFGGCFKAWKGHVEQRVGSNGDNYEKGNKYNNFINYFLKQSCYLIQASHIVFQDNTCDVQHDSNSTWELFDLVFYNDRKWKCSKNKQQSTPSKVYNITVKEKFL